MADEVLKDQVFLKKLNEILADNYKNEEFGVKELAERIPMNRSQLYRKLHTTKGISASQYIREYRLQQAHKMLQKDVSTVSEISYKVGFNSPTYFNTSFKEYYGYPPGEVKYQKSIAINEDIDSNEIEKRRSNLGTEKHIEQKTSKKIVYRISLIVMILIIAVSYYIYSVYSNNLIPTIKKINNMSVAILPFEDMSQEKDNEWFVEGITIDIGTYLSKIKEFTVISGTSAKKWSKETGKTNSEIAKKLDIDYLLIGKVRKYKNELRITVQLFNANGTLEWSEDYNREFVDFLKLQQEVSQKIVEQLKIELTTTEKEILQKLPTENMEAYELVLRGRLLTHDMRSKEGLEESIELFEQAIVLDPNYAEAYAEIAYSYIVLMLLNRIDLDVGYNMANSYIEKALKIDPNTSEAYMAKAVLEFRRLKGSVWVEDNRFEGIKENFEKAIALNPNDAMTHMQYGRYLDEQVQDVKNSLIHFRTAHRLDPFLGTTNNYLFYFLIRNKKFEEAEEYLKKYAFVFSEKSQLNKESKLRVLKHKDWTESIRFYEDKIEKEPNNSTLYSLLGMTYNDVLNDDISSLKFTKKAYELDSTIHTNSNINFNTAGFYYFALLEVEKYKEAHELLQTKNFKLFSELQKSNFLFYYYYYQENYLKAQEVLKDSLMNESFIYLKKGINYAQLGERMKVDSLLQDMLAVNNGTIIITKAFVYAILEERDSMYIYLEKVSNVYTSAGFVNSRREFDPYRKEERYKAFLKKNYLPITHWNE